ncbi:MAG: NUDIX domain-containing protein [Treponema sp.]|jgi:8-oxo-dGTP diphosphatase|nr:NUDIX domain-containing protein [Treponema sp.]
MSAARISIAGIAITGETVFIARRLPGGALGGKWEFPGGKVEAGESDTAALIREYQEEFGVPIETGPLIGTARFEHQGMSRTLRAYRIFFTDREASRNFTLAEHSAWRWIPVRDLESCDLADSDRKLLPGLYAYMQAGAAR